MLIVNNNNNKVCVCVYKCQVYHKISLACVTGVFFKCARDVIQESASIQLSPGDISYFPNHKRKNTPKIQRATKAIKKCVLLALAMIFYIKLRWPRFHASCQTSGEASVTEVLSLSFKEKRNKIMNGRHILKEMRRTVNLPILK